MEDKLKLAKKLENITVIVLGLFAFLFPILFLTSVTDPFTIPKQALLAVVSLGGLLVMGARSVLTGAVRLKRTPFDLPVVLLGLSSLLSSIFAVNKSDSFIAFVPFLFSILLFFVVINNIRKEKDLQIITTLLIAGGAVSSVITLLSFFKIYLLPFAFAKSQSFTPFGSLFDQAIYLLIILSLGLYTAWPALRTRVVNGGRKVYVVGSFLIFVGLVVSAIGTLTVQKPSFMPFQIGFQTGFAAISQDTGRVIQGFLVGSGVGTYLTDFTRFKPATINADAILWNLTFLRSSSFALELLATTGLLGILSFIFLCYRVLKSRPVYAPLAILIVLSFLIPFSFTNIVLLFLILAIYSAQQDLQERQKTKFFDVELKLVALKRGVFALSNPESRTESEYGNLLPWGFLGVIALFSLLVGVVSARFVISDYLFQQSLVAASQNNAQRTYQLQTDAINMFPQRDAYHRIFSQINLTLANNIALSLNGKQPTADVQQTITQLIQQSINSARLATTVSPQTAIDWQNLSSVYRSLIGFGQNADQFAIATAQQALVLDPNNPQEYINYGGIFYQLQQWDNAIRQFQIAASLKPDFANAYYNLGHALEMKGDLQGALAQYQAVRNLVGTDKTSLAQIDNEIKSLQDKIGTAEGKSATTQGTAENQPPLEVNQPSAKLPDQNPQVKIPAPKTSITPTPTATETPTPTPAP